MSDLSGWQPVLDSVERRTDNGHKGRYPAKPSLTKFYREAAWLNRHTGFLPELANPAAR